MDYGLTLYQIMKEYAGKYLLVFEGAVPIGDDGIFCTVGGKPVVEQLRIATGFAMYVMIYPNSFAASILGPVNHWLINEYIVHILHHYVAWIIVVFAIIHLYMATRADWMEKGGEISGMISGS